MSRLDPATLFFASSVAFAAVAGVLAFYSATQRTYAGFRDWLAGAATVAVILFGYFAFGAAGRPSPLPNLAVNVLVVVAVDRFARGTARFAGEAARVRAAELAVYGAGLLAYVWWLGPSPHAPRRIAVVSLCLAFAAARTSLVARRLARGAYRTSGLLLVYAAAALAALLLAHAGAALHLGDPLPPDVVRRTPPEIVLVAGAVGATVLAALAFMMLNARRTTVELEEALGQVKQLEGIIHICMYCKKVRVDSDSWTRIEKYVCQHTNAEFSHGICPECFQREHGPLPAR